MTKSNNIDQDGPIDARRDEDLNSAVDLVEEIARDNPAATPFAGGGWSTSDDVKIVTPPRDKRMFAPSKFGTKSHEACWTSARNPE